MLQPSKERMSELAASTELPPELQGAVKTMVRMAAVQAGPEKAAVQQAAAGTAGMAGQPAKTPSSGDGAVVDILRGMLAAWERRPQGQARTGGLGGTAATSTGAAAAGGAGAAVTVLAARTSRGASDVQRCNADLQQCLQQLIPVTICSSLATFLPVPLSCTRAQLLRPGLVQLQAYSWQLDSQRWPLQQCPAALVLDCPGWGVCVTHMRVNSGMFRRVTRGTMID